MTTGPLAVTPRRRRSIMPHAIESTSIDPQAWLADVLGQIADIPQGRLAELLPWNWKQPNLRAAA